MASILDQYEQASVTDNLNPFLGPDVAEPVREASGVLKLIFRALSVENSPDLSIHELS